MRGSEGFQVVALDPGHGVGFGNGETVRMRAEDRFGQLLAGDEFRRGALFLDLAGEVRLRQLHFVLRIRRVARDVAEQLQQARRELGERGGGNGGGVVVDVGVHGAADGAQILFQLPAAARRRSFQGHAAGQLRHTSRPASGQKRQLDVDLRHVRQRGQDDGQTVGELLLGDGRPGDGAGWGGRGRGGLLRERRRGEEDDADHLATSGTRSMAVRFSGVRIFFAASCTCAAVTASKRSTTLLMRAGSS